MMGITVLITGLPASGKTTAAKALKFKLKGSYNVVLLDGDAVRKFLSSELGFSREDRKTNIERVAFVASKVSECDGIAICSLIAPYAEDRRVFRNMVEKTGWCVEVYLSTPLETCENHDPKGLYRRARRGEIENFTGISDPYEEPENPDLCLDTRDHSPDEVAHEIILKLEHMKMGYNSTEDTLKHIRTVGKFLSEATSELCRRASKHDHSKLIKPEKSAFDRETPKLQTLIYGTKEYIESVKKLGPALQHHYEHNSHHPEHYEDGINGMDLFDLVEMIADWKAATLRVKDGDINRSLEHNIGRFSIDPQLADILQNTIDRWEK